MAPESLMSMASSCRIINFYLDRDLCTAMAFFRVSEGFDFSDPCRLYCEHFCTVIDDSSLNFGRQRYMAVG